MKTQKECTTCDVHYYASLIQVAQHSFCLWLWMQRATKTFTCLVKSLLDEWAPSLYVGSLSHCHKLRAKWSVYLRKQYKCTLLLGARSVHVHNVREKQPVLVFTGRNEKPDPKTLNFLARAFDARVACTYDLYTMFIYKDYYMSLPVKRFKTCGGGQNGGVSTIHVGGGSPEELSGPPLS